MCTPKEEQILFNKAFDGLPKGTKYNMFSCVVYKMGSGKYKIESTDENHLGNSKYYKNIDAIPYEVQVKLKQLMWVSPDDQTMTDTLGIRIGDSIFWIV